ncbi:MAG: hypothetical protein M1812_004134 [Candelaria pacifica]|nr:MAG: hypothetical protein M1812_004134 [Candelaria pacifica]
MTSSPTSPLESAISALLTTYQDLNNPTPEILTTPPSPLEFLRYVSQNKPFVIRGGASEWPATKKWNAEYLVGVMGDEKIQVAVTPSGNADSPVVCGDGEEGEGELRFVKPLEIEEDFEGFLRYIRKQEGGLECGNINIEEENNKNNSQEEVKYAQTQNDNLRNEYSSLFKDVEKDIAWARIALAKKPEAINLWIGNSRSVTALHKDNYENLYVQIVGRKSFVLVPPIEAVCVRERELRSATYVRDGEGRLVVRDDVGGGLVPTATWDPDEQGEERTGFEGMSRPVRVSLEEGDMLYLPALW